MKAVWKFPLALSTRPQPVEMPTGAGVRHVAHQMIGGEPAVVMWAEVNTNLPRVRRTFRVFATGEAIDHGCRYIGTAFVDWTVWHVYEVTP